jgi:hypothetical protein
MSSRLDYINQVRVNEFGHVHIPPPRVDPRERERLLNEAEERGRQMKVKLAEEAAAQAEWERIQADRRKSHYAEEMAILADRNAQIVELKSKKELFRQELVSAEAVVSEIEHELTAIKELAKRQVLAEKLIPMIIAEIGLLEANIRKLTEEAESAAHRIRSDILSDFGRSRFGDWKRGRIEQLRAAIHEDLVARYGVQPKEEMVEQILKTLPEYERVHAALEMPESDCIDVAGWLRTIGEIEVLERPLDAGPQPKTKKKGHHVICEA